MCKLTEMGIDKAWVQERFYYDPSDPQHPLRYNRDITQGSNPKKIGDKVGYVSPVGYVRCNLHKDGHRTNVQVAKLVLILHDVDIEDLSSDHIDGDKTNNLIENLRAVPQQVNCKNKGIMSNNRSGVTGVWFEEERQRFIATIGNGNTARLSNGRRKHFSIFEYGSYEKALEAGAEWRRKMELKDGDYTERHGRLLEEAD